MEQLPEVFGGFQDRDCPAAEPEELRSVARSSWASWRRASHHPTPSVAFHRNCNVILSILDGIHMRKLTLATLVVISWTAAARSEERRVGKEGRSRRSP